MRNIIIKFTGIIFLLMHSIYIFPVELNFKFYKAEEGLSSNTIYTALQDSKGFMWFGTENGLNRFDGYSFTIYQHTPRNPHSLIHNIVYSLAEDNNGHIWIGTERGVCSFNLNQKTFHPFTLSTKSGKTINGRIQSIICYDNKIWIASARQGVFIKENNELKCYSFDEFKIDPAASIWVNHLYKDNENIFWVSVENTKHQIYRFDPTSKHFKPAFPNLPINEQRQLRTYSILEDSFGTLWFGTWTNGLIGIDKKKGTINGKYLNIPGKDHILHIHQLTEYEPGLLLIGSNDGLTSFRVSPQAIGKLDQHITEPKLSNRFVYPIYKDHEGGLWVGTYYGGINYASLNRNYFTGYKHIKHENSISGNVVSCFAEDYDGNIWIGTEDGGLNELDLSTGIINSYDLYNGKKNSSNNNVHSLCIVDNGLWIGTYAEGLKIMNLSTKEVKHYEANPDDPNSLDSNSIYSIFQDKNGTIWIGTTSGINRYNPLEDNFTTVRVTNEFVMDIAQLDNYVWFATINKGLQRYDLDTDEWKEYQFETDNKESLISNNIISLCVDEHKQLWIGTNNGLCRYDIQNDSFIKEEISFPSNYICKMLYDKQTLWITTLRGLISYQPGSGKYRQFNTSDGLLSDLFTPNSGFKSSTGRIYIGTPIGVNAFYPHQLAINDFKAPVSLTDFQLFNKSVKIEEFLREDKKKSQQLVLSHYDNSFSFEFTSLSYFAPEKNNYTFILEGFDKEWNEVGSNRRATYTNIQPGKYLFKVRATNNDGVWSNQEYTMPILITPPIWWNRWSISLYILLIIASLIYLFYWLQNKERKKHKEMIRKIQNEKERETYRSQIEFFTNVAHEIRTPLSLIIAPLQQVIANSKSLPETMLKDLAIMKSNSKRLLTLVNQLLDFSKIEKGGVQISLSPKNIDRILFETSNRFIPLLKQKNIHFKYISDTTELVIMTDPENLTKIVSNLLSNAIKYTKDEITLQLDTQSNPGHFHISVIDNGNGLSPDEINNIFTPFYQVSGKNQLGTGLGLSLVKSIVVALKGSIEIQNNPDQGLTFELTLPLINSEGETNSVQPSTIEFHERINIAPEIQNIPTEEEPCPDPDEEKPSLLLVDDDEEILSFMNRQLMKDYTVYTATDGNEGIAVLKKEEVDLIISDLMMPGMDGITFCEAVKNNYMWSHIPVIMLTAKTNIGSKIDAYDIGADAYLEKPFQIPHLVSRIRNLLESRRKLFHKFTQTPYSTLKSIAGNDADKEFLIKINEIITRNIGNPEFSVNILAEEAGISSSGLFSKIKKITGVTPNRLIQTMRLKKAAELLGENRYRINEICYMVGFNNPSYFSKCFQKQFGKPPKDFTKTSKDDALDIENTA